jgi:hypothetical protein
VIAPQTTSTHPFTSVPAKRADVPEMLELVARTGPGPFLARTIELGDYLGIRRDGRSHERLPSSIVEREGSTTTELLPSPVPASGLSETHPAELAQVGYRHGNKEHPPIQSRLGDS